MRRSFSSYRAISCKKYCQKVFYIRIQFDVTIERLKVEALIPEFPGYVKRKFFEKKAAIKLATMKLTNFGRTILGEKTR